MGRQHALTPHPVIPIGTRKARNHELRTHGFGNRRAFVLNRIRLNELDRLPRAVHRRHRLNGSLISESKGILPAVTPRRITVTRAEHDESPEEDGGRRRHAPAAVQPTREDKPLLLTLAHERNEIAARNQELPFVAGLHAIASQHATRMRRRDGPTDNLKIGVRKRVHQPAAVGELTRTLTGVPALEYSRANLGLTRRGRSRERRHRDKPTTKQAVVFQNQRDKRTICIGENTDLAGLDARIELGLAPRRLTSEDRTLQARTINAPFVQKEVVHITPPSFARMSSASPFSQVSSKRRPKSGSSAPSIRFNSLSNSCMALSLIA